MKVLIPICLLSLILISCDQPGTQTGTQNYTKFDLFVKRFESQNPKMWTNDLTKDEANEKFRPLLLNYFRDSSGLSSIPLYVRSINKLDNSYVIHLENSSFAPQNDISQSSHIDIFAFSKDSIARPLIQGDSAQYFITKYRKLKVLTAERLHKITTDMVYSAGAELVSPTDSHAIGGNSYGNYTLEVIEIKKTE